MLGEWNFCVGEFYVEKRVRGRSRINYGCVRFSINFCYRFEDLLDTLLQL